MSKIFEQIVKKRELDDSFLHPQYENLADPFVLPGMKEAVWRIKQAIDGHENILIYGDYDADGVTASTLMEQALIFAGVKSGKIQIMLPDRFADGYGMSPRMIERAKDWGAKLVITVDCGSRNHAIIEELSINGIDCIVTDHHETDAKMPEAVAVLNPKRKDQPTEDLKDLAGVGVAFKLAQALVKEGLIPAGREKWLLDLVVIGTICDSMRIIGENRILCYFGLIVLGKTKRVGLTELMRRAGVKNLHSEAIGFQIGPRINAAGRLKTAELSLNLLRATSAPEAAVLASELEELNKKRKTEQISAIREIKERGLVPGPVIVETGRWHEGIIGIVAGKLVDDYAKPAFVLTELDGGVYKGSGRSFGDFNLANALEYVKDEIISGGGHAGAAGVKVDSEHLYAFRERMNDYYQGLKLKGQEKFLKQVPDLTLRDFSELSLGLLEELRSLEPYGAGNEEPVFRLAGAKICDIQRMGAEGQHIRINLEDKDGKGLKLVGFYAPDEWLNLTVDDEVEPIVRLVDNEFNGVHALEARIIDIM